MSKNFKIYHLKIIIFGMNFYSVSSWLRFLLTSALSQGTYFSKGSMDNLFLSWIFNSIDRNQCRFLYRWLPTFDICIKKLLFFIPILEIVWFNNDRKDIISTICISSKQTTLSTSNLAKYLNTLSLILLDVSDPK